MKNSFQEYLSEKSMIAVWFKTPRWIALCLPAIVIMHKIFISGLIGGLISFSLAVFNLTPIGLLYNAWVGFVFTFEGKSFFEGFTGVTRPSTPFFTVISFDLLLFAVLYSLFYFNKNKMKKRMEKETKEKEQNV